MCGEIHAHKLTLLLKKHQLHIPIEELRARANEVPKDKEVVVFCILSTRGFEGQLILNNAGYDNVKFVQGGIQFWQKWKNKHAPFQVEKWSNKGLFTWKGAYLMVRKTKIYLWNESKYRFLISKN